jgi:diacylglycerol kinase (ATP)
LYRNTLVEAFMLQPDTCVIFNPSSGRGRSARRLAAVRRAWAERAVFWPTSAPGDAEELALRAAQSGFATVAAAGGDGTVHEVANGLLRAERPDVILALLPTGSANDYASCLGVEANWWRSEGVLQPHAVDVGIVRAPGRRRYFVNGLGLGFNGTVTRESRRIHWLQGVALYGLAVLRTLCFRYELIPMCVRIDDEERRTPTLALSLALGKREGNFVVAPQAELDDGLFDYIHAGSLRRRDLARLLPSLFGGGGLPCDRPNLWLGRCRQVRLQAESPLVVHTDGELFCVTEDGIRELEIDLLPQALRVLGRSLTDSGRANGAR